MSNRNKSDGSGGLGMGVLLGVMPRWKPKKLLHGSAVFFFKVF